MNQKTYLRSNRFSAFSKISICIFSSKIRYWLKALRNFSLLVLKTLHKLLCHHHKLISGPIILMLFFVSCFRIFILCELYQRLCKRNIIFENITRKYEFIFLSLAVVQIESSQKQSHLSHIFYNTTIIIYFISYKFCIIVINR